MTDETKRNWLERPEFSPIPPKTPRPQKKMEFEGILEIVRQHPDSWAIIAEYKASKEGKNRARQLNMNDETRIRTWLKKWKPLEYWEFHSQLVPETWGDRAMRVRYRGEMEPEDALKLREARANYYWQRPRKGLPEHEKAQQRTRAKAELEMVENRIHKSLLG